MTLLRRAAGTAAAAALAAAATGAAAQDVAAGKARAAAACAACHGPVGISTLPVAPHLAGQPKDYLAEQLRHYRSGKRAHEMMTLIARPLSDREIDELSAWYASIQIEARER